MYTEYRIAYKTREWEYWGEFAHIFEDYSDAEREFDKLMLENPFDADAYKIIKITHEVVREEKVSD